MTNVIQFKKKPTKVGELTIDIQWEVLESGIWYKIGDSEWKQATPDGVDEFMKDVRGGIE